MSRIHEALKKAEQERAANHGGMPGGSTAAPIPEAIPFNGGAAVAVDASPAHLGPNATFTIPSPGDPFDLDSRCPLSDWRPDASTMLFLNGDSHSEGTEEFRTLRSRLYTLREKMPLKKLLITSALPREGKSFTAANLAQVLVRQHGRRALLIDADLRGPRLHLMLGTAQGPGLSDYLEGRNDEFSILQRGPLENLFFIPSGTATGDPAELVGGGRMKVLMQRLEPLFDWIIVDSPPAIPVSDASLLAKACDGVLMVVLSNMTPAELARKAREEFPEEALVGVVLNGTREKLEAYERYYYEAYQKNGNTGTKS